MSNTQFPSDWRIEKIEYAALEGIRPRFAGGNSRLRTHGLMVSYPLVRVTIGGISGFGWSRIDRKEAGDLAGVHASRLFAEDGKVAPPFRSIEFALLDWLGAVRQQPVYAIVGKREIAAPLRVPCYDTSLLFDDLHLQHDAEAVALLQAEAEEGAARGHRNFKIKIGRGARFMSLAEGMQRDTAIVNGVRQKVGTAAKLMVDANNGYNLNMAKQFLQATEEAGVYWLEEAFHEDPELYADLKDWLGGRGSHTLIADGEGLAAPPVIEWATKGLIDVVQYDVRFYGFTNWLELAEKLDAAGVKSAPHNYGSSYGNYVTGHLAAAIDHFQFVEWDEMSVEGIDASAYKVKDGMVSIPSAPGFGIQLDDVLYRRKISETGWIAET